MFWYDIFIIAVVGAGFLYGFLKGILSEVFALTGLVIGFIVGLKFSFLIKPYLLPVVKNETISVIVGFIILFLCTAAIIILIGILFKKAIRFVRLSWLDRLVGGLFGIIKGIIISGLISLLIFAFLPGGKTLIDKSTLGKRAVSIVNIAVYLLPEKIQEKLHSK
jgi:membrane protein required for colicin V production